MSVSLYQLTHEFLEIQAQLEEMELDADTLADTLDSLTLPIEEKVENIVKYMKTLEALAEAKKTEAKRLQESAASDLKKAEYFKNYMADNLQKVGLREIQAGIFKVGFRKGSEVVQVDEETLPAPYWIPQPSKPMSKTELKQRIKNGENIIGVSLVRNPDTLQIK